MGWNPFESKTELLDTRTSEAKTADQYLAALLGKGTPDIPQEQIAGMSDAEKLAQELVGKYGASTPEGLDTLWGIANGPTDVTQDPTISALMEVIGKRGDQTANRLNRSLMLRGGRGGAGRDMLGRVVTDTQNEMMSNLAGYASEAKNRQMSAAQILNNLGENSTLNRLNALSTTGSLPRTLQQMQNSAAYNKLMTQIMFPYQQQAQIASAIKQGGKMDVVKSDSLFSQIAPLLGTAVTMAMNPSAGAAQAAGQAMKNKGIPGTGNPYSVYA
jgi:hypothetical protein